MLSLLKKQIFQQGAGTDEKVLTEIIASRTPEELRAIKQAYEEGKQLEFIICPFCRVDVVLCGCGTRQHMTVEWKSWMSGYSSSIKTKQQQNNKRTNSHGFTPSGYSN